MDAMLGIFAGHRQGGRRRLARAARLGCEVLEGRALLSVSPFVLNEAWPDPYGNPSTYQFVEIAGPKSTALSQLEFVSIDGYGGGNPTGTVTYAVDLGGLGLKTGTNGLLLIKAQEGGVTSLDGNTAVYLDPNLNSGTSGLGGGTRLYALIDYAGSGGAPIAVGTELDPNNTGTITLPAGDALVDGFEFVYHSTPNLTDRAYNVINGAGAPAGYPASASNSQLFLPLSPNGNGITPDAASRQNPGTYVSGSSFNPATVWSFGWTNSGSTTYQTGDDSIVIPTGEPATYYNNGAAVTPGGLNTDAVVLFNSNGYSVVQGNAVTITVQRINGGVSYTGAKTESVNDQAVNGTAVLNTNYDRPSVARLTFTPTTNPPTTDTKTYTIQTINTNQSGELFFSVVLNLRSGIYLGSPNVATVDIEATATPTAVNPTNTIPTLEIVSLVDPTATTHHKPS
jgi:hypothetical protein